MSATIYSDNQKRILKLVWVAAIITSILTMLGLLLFLYPLGVWFFYGAIRLIFFIWQRSVIPTPNLS
jgi:hypothetical protein